MIGCRAVRRGLASPCEGDGPAPTLTAKVCLLGDPAVGKSSLVHAMAGDRFNEMYVTTVGARVLKKTVTVHHPASGRDIRVRLMLWEITGHLGPAAAHPFLGGADAAIVVADMARLDTQIGLWRWVEAARSSGRDIPVVLVVNKMDLLDPGFDSGIVLELSAEYASPCFYTSARAGENILQALDGVAATLARRALSAG